MPQAPKNHYLMSPRCERETYLQGFHGYKTLVVGAAITCSNFDEKHCTYTKQCAQDWRPFNKSCPCYCQSPLPEHCLEQENVIEVESFLEGDNTPYLKFFTMGMLELEDEISIEQRINFWDHVAFYNYHQQILVTKETETKPNVPFYEGDGPAFQAVLDEFQPEIIYTWFANIRDLIVALHIPDLVEVDAFSANSITIYRFLYRPKKSISLSAFMSKMKKWEPQLFEQTSPMAPYPVDALACSLQALYQARHYQPKLDSIYEPAPETVQNCEPYAWDLDLYHALQKEWQKIIGLDKVMPILKKRILQTAETEEATYGAKSIALNIDWGENGVIPFFEEAAPELSLFAYTYPNTFQGIKSANWKTMVLYLDEEAGLKSIQRLKQLHLLEDQKLFLLMSENTAARLEDALLKFPLQGITSIQEQWVTLEIGNTNFMNIKIGGNGKYTQTTRLDNLLKQPKGKKLSISETLERQKKYQKITTDPSVLQILQNLIKKEFITALPIEGFNVSNKSFEITISKKAKRNPGRRVKVEGKNAPAGGIYFFISQEIDLSIADIQLLFPTETRSIAELMRAFRDSIGGGKGMSYMNDDVYTLPVLRDLFR